VKDELVYRDGALGVPELPGLGVELNQEAVAEFSEAARRVTLAG
jgi:L-alanine-DL-glutamate epimerase-like enolase superfamily enzyme